MRKLLTILLIFGGCAWGAKQVDYATACNADPTCLADAKSKASLVQTVATVAYPPIGGVAGGVALIFLLWLGGKKKEEKK